MDHKRKQKVSGIFVVLLVLMLLIGGSLAWQDVTQHKTNTFKTTSVKHNVVLVEEFKPVLEWKMNEAKDNKISVRNGQSTDDNTKFVYDDAYVRIQLKEFMSLQKVEYDTFEERLMVDTSGNFITGIDEAELKSKLASAGVSVIDDTRIKAYPNYLDDDADDLYYYQTAAEDVNGQYGKFLVEKERNVGDAISLVDGVSDHSADAESKHQAHVNGEDSYTVHRWEKGRGDYAQASSPFNEYIEWQLGDDVIAFDDWDKTPVDKWILDTNSDEGWVYWGKPLVHDTQALVYKSSTSNLLEKVELIKNPDGKANYYIHVNLDAVSHSDLSLWDDAPDEIIDIFEGDKDEDVSKEALKMSIDKAVSLNPSGDRPASKDLQNEIKAAKKVYDNSKATQKEVDDAKEELDKKIHLYEIDLLRLNLDSLIKEADNISADKYTDDSYDELIKTKHEGEVVYMKDVTEVSKSELELAISNLENALQNLELKKLEAGDRIEFAGHFWTLLAKDGDYSLVIVDELTLEDLEEMGVDKPFNDQNLIKYQTTNNRRVDYEVSNLKTADEAFFKTYLEDDEKVLKAIQPVKISQEPQLGAQDFAKQSEHPTKIDSQGTKTAFSLSVSDFNKHSINFNHLTNHSGTWLRSPGGRVSEVTVISSAGNPAKTQITGSNKLSPAVWIDLSMLP